MYAVFFSFSKADSYRAREWTEAAKLRDAAGCVQGDSLELR